MTDVPRTRTDGAAVVEPTWGLGDAAAGLLAAFVLGQVIAAVIVAAAGYAGAKQSALPLWLIAVTEIPLWIGFVGAPLYAARVKGNGVVADFGLRIRALDVPLGVAVGLAAQFVLAPLVSWPWVVALRRHMSDLNGVAKSLTDKAHHSPGGVVLLVLVVAIAAPICEELFYRGLVLRALQRRFGAGWAIIGSGLLFGATHFELLQFPALTAFGMVLGLLAVRTGRLGPSICAHMAFNGVVVFVLVR